MSTQPKVPVVPLAQWNLLNLRGGLGFRLFWSAGLPFHLLGTAAPGQQHHHLHLTRLWTFICPIHSNLKNGPNSHRSKSHSCFKRKEKVWFRILKSYSILISLKSLQNPEFRSKILCQNPKKKPCRNAICRVLELLRTSSRLLLEPHFLPVTTSQPVAANDRIMMGYGISNMVIVIVMVIFIIYLFS